LPRATAGCGCGRLHGFWAVAWPLQIDTFIGVGELALFVALADSWPARSRAAAWGVTVLGLAVSVAGNVGHVQVHSLASRATAAVPPLAAAAALAVGLGVLKRVVGTQGYRSPCGDAPEAHRQTVHGPADESTSRHSDRAPALNGQAHGRVLQPAGGQADRRLGVQHEPAGRSLHTTPPGPGRTSGSAAGRTRTRSRSRARSAPVTGQDAEREFVAELAVGALPSLRTIRARLHVGQERARGLLEHLESLTRT
jgi:hypothetical protein